MKGVRSPTTELPINPPQHLRQHQQRIFRHRLDNHQQAPKLLRLEAITRRMDLMISGMNLGVQTTFHSELF